MICRIEGYAAIALTTMGLLTKFVKLDVRQLIICCGLLTFLVMLGGFSVDFPLLIRQRLKELGIGQGDLAAAAQVTESYISQLLTGKKPPPAPERTDIYDRMDTLLKLPAGHLAKLADVQRKDVLKRRLADPPAPLFKGVRELVLRKCAPGKEKSIRAVFEKEPFGALERLVTQKLLDVVKRVTREELDDESWLRLVARLSDRSYEQLRVIVLEFLETDVFNVSDENCVTFLDPLIESWDIDLATFGMEIVLNRRLAPGHPKKFEFVEREPSAPVDGEPGLKAFLEDASLSGGATEDEIAFLKTLKFRRKRPTPLYYYRELQNLRDPLHFRRTSTEEERS
jgi:transcriptional regulator with XRE-family HTH domain